MDYGFKKSKMKKTILLLGVMLGALSAKAQIIAGLDEVALMGNWKATEYWGVWENLGYKWPTELQLNDGKNSLIYTKSNSSTDPILLEFNGYWIGGTATGHYTLHFICRREYDSTYTGLSMVNFVIKNFNGNSLTIETYDGSGGATFINDNSGVNEVSADTPEAYSIYNSNGIKIENPTAPGLYIRGNGDKFIKK